MSTLTSSAPVDEPRTSRVETMPSRTEELLPMSSVAEPSVALVDATAMARGPTEGPIGAPSWTGPRTAGTPTLAMSSAVARAAALNCTALTCSTTVCER